MLSWSRDASFFRHFVQQGPELQHLVVMRARARVYAACHRLHLRRGLPDAQQVVIDLFTFEPPVPEWDNFDASSGPAHPAEEDPDSTLSGGAFDRGLIRSRQPTHPRSLRQQQLLPPQPGPWASTSGMHSLTRSTPQISDYYARKHYGTTRAEWQARF